MIILEDFTLNYEAIIKAVAAADQPLRKAGPATPATPKAPAAPAAPSAGGTAPATGGGGLGGTTRGGPSSKPKPGHKYVSREWNGTTWDYVWPGEGTVSHSHNAEYGDHARGQHVMEIPDTHPAVLSGNARDAYHAMHDETFAPGKTHDIAHPHPENGAKGERVTVSVGPDKKISVLGADGVPLRGAEGLTRNQYESWHRTQQQGPVTLHGLTGKPWVHAGPAGLSKPTAAQTAAGDARDKHGIPSIGGQDSWKARFLTQQDHPDVDPEFAPDVKDKNAGVRANSKPELLNKLLRKMADDGRYDGKHLLHVEELLEQAIKADPVGAANIKSGGKAGRVHIAGTPFADREAVRAGQDSAGTAASAQPVQSEQDSAEGAETPAPGEPRTILLDPDQVDAELKSSEHPAIAVYNAHLQNEKNTKTGLRRKVFNPPPEVMHKLVTDYIKQLAPVAQKQMVSSIVTHHPGNDFAKDSMAQDFGLSDFKTLANKKNAEQIATMMLAPESHGYRQIAAALRTFKPGRITEGDKRDVGARLDSHVQDYVTKPIQRHAGIFAKEAETRAQSLGVKARDGATQERGAKRDPGAEAAYGKTGSSERAEARTLGEIDEVAPSLEAQVTHGEEAQRAARHDLSDEEYDKIKTKVRSLPKISDDYSQMRAGYTGEKYEKPQDFGPEESDVVTGPVAKDMRQWQNLQHSKLTQGISAANEAGDANAVNFLTQARSHLAQITNPRLDPKDQFNRYNQWTEAVNKQGHGKHLVEVTEDAFKSLFAVLKAIAAIKADMLLRKANSPTILTKDKKVDPSHTYSHMEGDSDHTSFFYRDSVGNYLRYSNAPTGHPDRSPRFGEAALHPSEPSPTKASQFFDAKGRKLTRAPYPGVQIQWNPNYHKEDPKNLWAGRWVNPNSGEHEYTYMDSDFRENPNLRRHQEVVLTDSRLPALREAVNKLSSSPHVKDNVTAFALALIDQGHFRADELTALTVGDVKDIGSLYKVGTRYIYPDHKLRRMLESLTMGRSPDEPLLAVPFSKRNGELDVELLRRVGKHYLICTLDQLGLSFNGLQQYHATQAFSREATRLVVENHAPWASAVEYATFAVAQEMGIDVTADADTANSLAVIRELYVDPIALALLEENAGKIGVAMLQPVVLPLPPPPIMYVAMNLTARTADEELFSRWLHNFPTHLPDTATTPLPVPPNSPNMTEMAA